MNLNGKESKGEQSTTLSYFAHLNTYAWKERGSTIYTVQKYYCQQEKLRRTKTNK